MKHLTFLLSLSLLSACSTTSPERPLKHFHESNFGATFSHSEALSTSYNPHGGANVVIISWRDKPVGALHIHRLPPTTNDADFVSSGEDYFKKKYRASSVEYRLHENPRKYEFHVFRMKVADNGTDYLAERFVHFRRIRSKEWSEAQLDQMFGTFSFEFIASTTDYPALEKEIQTVIDTFSLDERR